MRQKKTLTPAALDWPDLGTRMETYRWVLVLLALSLTGAVCYGPYLNNFFAFDDFRYLENIITGPKAVMLGYYAQLRLVSNFAWVPLFWLSGFDPFGYNLFNLIMAVVNAFLFYLLLGRLFERKDIPLISAFVFLASPAGADAIFWKMSLSTLLSLFFVLSTLNLYLSYRKTGKMAYFVAALPVYLLAMFSKDDAASMVAVLIAMEILFFEGGREWLRLAKRILPFVLAVALFLTTTSLAYHLLGLKSETWGAFKIRPFYSLLGGFSSFFIAPNGFLNMNDPRIYLSAVLIPGAFLVVRDRKVAMFACLWILVTFLPSSLTTIAQFEPRSFPNSISRFLYTPSAGAALLLGTVLADVAMRFGNRARMLIILAFMVPFVALGAARAHARGEEWAASSEQMNAFFTEMKKQVPKLPPKTFIFVVNAPGGRAFIQQGLRAFYRNPGITWISDPQNFNPSSGDASLLITCEWGDQGRLKLQVNGF